MQKLLRVIAIASSCLISLGAYATSCTETSPCWTYSTTSSTSTSTSSSTSNAYTYGATSSFSSSTLNGAIGYGDIHLNGETVPFAVTTLSAENLNSVIGMNSLSSANSELSLISSFVGFGTPKVPVIAFGNDVFFASSSFNVQDPSAFLLYVAAQYPGISFTDATLGSGAALASSTMMQSQTTSFLNSSLEVVQTSSQTNTESVTCSWTSGNYICKDITNINTNYNTDYHTTNHYLYNTNTDYNSTYADWTRYDYYAQAAPGTVSEPGSLFLLGTALVGAAGALRRNLNR